MVQGRGLLVHYSRSWWTYCADTYKPDAFSSSLGKWESQQLIDLDSDSWCSAGLLVFLDGYWLLKYWLCMLMHHPLSPCAIPRMTMEGIPWPCCSHKNDHLSLHFAIFVPTEREEAEVQYPWQYQLRRKMLCKKKTIISYIEFLPWDPDENQAHMKHCWFKIHE